MKLITLLKLDLTEALTASLAGFPPALLENVSKRLSATDINGLLTKIFSNPSYFLPILAIVIIGGIIAAIVAKVKAKHRRLRKDVLLTPVGKLTPELLGIEQYKNGDCYVERESDDQIAELLGEGRPRMLVTGRTGSGKTRTIYEAIKEMKDFVLLAPKHHTISSDKLKTITHLHKKKVFLLLDDLHKYVRKVDVAMLIGLLENNTRELVVLATCRSGDTLELVDGVKPSFLEHFETQSRIELRDLNAEEEEALAKLLERPWSSTMYDHTPGSVAVNLPEMRKRYKGTSSGAMTIIELLKLLHSCHINTYKESLVKKLFSAALEKDPENKGNWGKSLAEVVESGLVARKEGDLHIYDAYLEDDFVDNYTPDADDYQALEEILTKEKDAEALFSLGVFYETRDMPDKSIGALEKVVKLDPHHIEARLCLADAYEKSDMLEEAVTQYEEVMKDSPDNSQVHYRLGLIYANQGMVESALEEIKKTIDINPNLIEAHYNLGLIYEKKEQEDYAILEYRETIRLGPGHLHAHRNLALLYNKRGMIAEAIQEFKEVALLSPDDTEAHYILASAYSESGNAHEAAAEYKELVRINPDDVKAQYNLAVNYYKTREIGSAIEAFEKVVRIEPDNIKAHYNLGLAYYKKDMLDHAVKQYEEVLRLKPGYPAVYYNLALCYEKKGMIDEAMDGFKEAIRNYPNHPEAHRSLALAYNQNGMFGAAIEEFKEAIRIRPKDVTAHGGLALAYHKKGLVLEARKEFRIYEQLKLQTAKPGR